MTEKLAKILEYQEIDLELSDVEKKFHDSPVRKEYVVNGKKLSLFSDNVTRYEAKAKELLDEYKQATDQKSALMEEKTQIENSINECEDEVGAKYLKDQNKAIISKLDKLVADCEDLSNKISALLSEYSAYTKEVKLAKENYLKVKPEYEKLSEEINAKKEQIYKRLQEKEKEIDSEVMEKYKLKKKEQPSQKILYKCEGDFCAYCNQELSGLAKSKLNEHNVIECENCHKLLYN